MSFEVHGSLHLAVATEGDKMVIYSAIIHSVDVIAEYLARNGTCASYRFTIPDHIASKVTAFGFDLFLTRAFLLSCEWCDRPHHNSYTTSDATLRHIMMHPRPGIIVVDGETLDSFGDTYGTLLEKIRSAMKEVT